MKNAFFIFLFLGVNGFAQTKTGERTIGDLNGYHISIKVTSDESKRRNADHAVVSQKVVFRQKQKILTTKTFTVKAYDGYAISDLSIQKYKNRLYYELAFYRSNGSPEIYEIYNLNGKKLAKCTAARNGTTYTFFSKGIQSDFFEKSKTVKSCDLIKLWN